MTKILNTIFQIKVFLPLLIVFYILNFFINAEPFVRSDGFCNFQIAKSIINEGSFISKTEPEYWNYMGHVKEKFNDNYISVCTPGTALAILPGLSVANLFKGTDNIDNNFYLAYNGHTLLEGISIIITAIVFSLLSWILIFKTLKLLGFSEQNSWFSTLAVFLSSYALWYVFLLPSYTHTYEIFAVALIFYLFVKIQKQKSSPSLFSFILCGLASGFAVIVRPTLFPIVLLVFFSMIFQKRNLKQILVYILGGIPFILVFLAYNYISYGNALSFGYIAVRGETFSFSHLYIFEILFSPLKGWFIFSPIYLFSIAGLIFLFKRNKGLSIISILSIFIIALLYSAWSQWWGGGSYGSRFMCFALPFGAIGLASFLSYSKKFKNIIKKLLLILIILFTIFSTAILFLYRVVNVNGSWFYTPFFFFKTELNILKDTKSIPDIIKVNYDNIYEGSGILKLINKDFDYTLTILEETDNSNIIFKLFSPPNGTNYILPTDLSFYLVDNRVNRVYQGIWQSDNKFYVLNLKNIDFEKISNPINLKVQDYDQVNFPKNNFSMYIQQKKNVVIKGDIQFPPRDLIQYTIKSF